MINGNINELRAFALALKNKGLNIRWTGYARHDGRMDLAYLQDLKDGGCIMFNFGCESASQKVLDDMHKGVTVGEMEQNFIDCKKVGIWAATNWIVGFPTEELQDYSDTMTFMWRMRNNNINNMGLGVGYGLGPETIVGQNPHAYNVSFHKYQSFWITNDFRMGGPHIMTRVKCIHMWLDFFKNCTEVPIGYPIRESLSLYHYDIKLNDYNVQKEMHYEKFDYDIIPKISEDNSFANQLVNEMWPFFRNLWRARGGYTATVRFHPDIDMAEFGDTYGPAQYYAIYKFIISDEGVWYADFDIEFVQVDNPMDNRTPPPEGRKGPFYAQDYSRWQSNTVKRARKLAKPSWSNEEGRSDQDFTDLLNEEKYLNENIDFSFHLKWQGNGDWGDTDKYIVDVSNNKRDVLPEKESMSGKKVVSTISIDSIKRL